MSCGGRPYHEAGHAVVARVLGLTAGRASIVPNFRDLSAGYAITHDSWLILERWQDRGKFRGILSVLRGRIMGLMAGREAEIIAFGSAGVGDSEDLRQIDYLAGDETMPERYLDRLRSKVRALLQRHWRKVEAVAEALLVSQRLSGREIDALVRATLQPDERNVLARIAAARKSDRDLYRALGRAIGRRR